MGYETELTVKQLRKLLKKLDPDMPVVRYVGEDYYERPMFKPVRGIAVAENVWFEKREQDVVQIVG